MLRGDLQATTLALLVGALAAGCAQNAPCSYPIAQKVLAPAGLSAEPAYVPLVVVPGFGHKLRTTRWIADEPFVRVFVPTPELPDAALAARTVDAVRAGIEEWTGTLPSGGPRFSFVSERKLAAIEVMWKEDPAGLGTTAVGLSHEHRGQDALEWWADRFLELEPSLVRSETDLPVLQRCAAHEMGHILGLSGHSDDPADVLYPALNPAQGTVTERDRNTLRVLYACPRSAVWAGERPPLAMIWPGTRSAYDRYRVGPDHKAFAVLLDSRRLLAVWASASGKDTAEEAEAEALRKCNDERGEMRGECAILARDGEVVLEPADPRRH